VQIKEQNGDRRLRKRGEKIERKKIRETEVDKRKGT
jgi:hypothetical protein